MWIKDTERGRIINAKKIDEIRQLRKSISIYQSGISDPIYTRDYVSEQQAAYAFGIISNALFEKTNIEIPK